MYGCFLYQHFSVTLHHSKKSLLPKEERERQGGKEKGGKEKGGKGKEGKGKEEKERKQKEETKRKNIIQKPYVKIGQWKRTKI